VLFEKVSRHLRVDLAVVGFIVWKKMGEAKAKRESRKQEDDADYDSLTPEHELVPGLGLCVCRCLAFELPPTD
jgi:hypothetical protein